MQHIAPSKCPFLYQYTLPLVWDTVIVKAGGESLVTFITLAASRVEKGLKDVNCTPHGHTPGFRNQAT